MASHISLEISSRAARAFSRAWVTAPTMAPGLSGANTRNSGTVPARTPRSSSAKGRSSHSTFSRSFHERSASQGIASRRPW
jgi:hypothetical protein